MDATTQGTGIRAEFTGNPRRFFRLALIGNLLQIPTFGFYRFWLITDIRRHLWSNTRLAGDSFEYTGRARELLIGFLIALAILTPLYIGYFILSIEAERTKAFASLPFALVIYVLAHYGTYRARRYRATRTIFRGVRLWMTGSGWSYAWRAILWDMLTVVSLGLALPWRAASLERFKMRHTNFGDLGASFAGTGWSLFKRAFWCWLLAVPPGAALAVFGLYVIGYMAETNSVPFDQETLNKAFGAGMMASGVGLLIAFPFFRAIRLQWFLAGIRFESVSLASDLRKRRVLWCYLKATFFSIVFFLLSTCALFSVSWWLIPGNLTETDKWGIAANSAGGIAAFVILYLVILLGFSVIILQFVTRGIWQVAAESVTVFNLAALDSVAARGAAAGSLGEGLADALDFGAGVGV